MANRSSNAPDAIDTVATPADGRLAPQILTMFRAFMASPQRNKIVLLGVALVAVIGATAFGQVRLNAWNRPFYDALAHKDMGEFLIQLRVFVVIAAGLLVLNVAQAWLNQATKVGLRKGLVRDLLEEWLRPRRAFRLVDAGEIGANPPGTQELLCSCQSGKTRLPTREGNYLWSCVTFVISWPWPRN